MTVQRLVQRRHDGVAIYFVIGGTGHLSSLVAALVAPGFSRRSRHNYTTSCSAESGLPTSRSSSSTATRGRDGTLLVPLSDNLFAWVKSDQLPQSRALAIAGQLGDNHGLWDQTDRELTEVSARRKLANAVAEQQGDLFGGFERAAPSDSVKRAT